MSNKIPVYPTITPKIPLPQALEKIAKFLNLDAVLLAKYVEEDTLGGYHHDPAQQKTPHGIWGVEGQMLYALIRALKPAHILEVGTGWGTSMLHIGEALVVNGEGKVTTMDLPILKGGRHRSGVPKKYKTIVRPIDGNLRDFNYNTRPKLDFVFEDSSHLSEDVAHVWGQFMEKARDGAVIVSHDSEHFTLGRHIRAGIQQVTMEYISMAIDPADCGLAIGRK